MLPSTVDYTFLRETYTADEFYLRHNIERLSDDEQAPEYEHRLRVAPSPTQARRLVKRILRAFADKARLIVRYGQLIDKVESAQGIAGDGSTVNQFVTKLGEELLVVGRVGVYVTDVAGIETGSDALRSRPFAKIVKYEDVSTIEPAPAGSPSAYGLVEFKSDGEVTRLWIADDGKVFGSVTVKGRPGEPVDLGTDSIPFVLIESESVIALVAQHQKTLANLLSVMAVESPGLLQSFLTRQRDRFNVGAHQRGIDDESIQIGRNRGLWYTKGENQPAYVGPPASPATEARMWAEWLVDDMNRLAGVSGDTFEERREMLAAAAGELGDALFAAELQVWRHLGRYFAVTDPPVIRYPLSYIAQSEADRQADISAMFANAQRASGRQGMEIGTALAMERLTAGQTSQEIANAVAAVKKSRCLANDLMNVTRAYEARGLDTKTLADVFGCLPVVANDAKTEAHERTVELAQAAAAAQATKSADSVDTERDGALAEKRLSQAEGNGAVRAEGR
jgi:hypothetical protein